MIPCLERENDNKAQKLDQKRSSNSWRTSTQQGISDWDGVLVKKERRCVDIKDVVMHHGRKDDGMGIWCKKIDEGNKECMRKYILDYL